VAMHQQSVEALCQRNSHDDDCDNAYNECNSFSPTFHLIVNSILHKNRCKSCHLWEIYKHSFPRNSIEQLTIVNI